MLQRIARLAIAAPRRILAVAILVMVAAAVFGIPAASQIGRVDQIARQDCELAAFGVRHPRPSRAWPAR